MSRVCKESRGVKATVELGTRVVVFGGHLGGLLILDLGLMEDPLLVIGEELDEYECEDGLGEEIVV